MEERQITEGGVTYVLEDPFLVIATQNPVESQGTFPLPEAQLDRFLMRLSLGYPSHEESIQLLRRFAESQPLSKIGSVATREELRSAAELCGSCHVSEAVMDYMVSLCEAARDPEKVRLGPSPRALLALMRACQAYAAIQGREFVIPDDVKALAVPVLAHRILLRGLSYQNTAESFLCTLLDNVPAPTESAL
jgi:MoxR-like ATPase